MAANPKVKTTVIWICRLLLGGTFAYAAALKIANPSAFATDIAHFRLLPHPLALALGLYLPWLELICGSGVIVRRFESAALLLIALMCGIFFAALTSAWFRSLDISCGCFGHAASTTLPIAIARSAALGLLALFLFRQNRSAGATLP